MGRWTSKLALPLLAVTLVATACGGNSGNEPKPAATNPAAAEVSADENGITIGAPEKTKVTLRLNWKFKGEFAPFFVTKEKGIFEKYGLDVEVLEGTSSVQTLQVLSQNKEDIGVMSTAEPMQGIEQGMPVKIIASYMSRSPIILLSYPDNPIKTPADLEGKSIASSISSTFTSLYDKFIEHNGVDGSKVKLVKMETGARNTAFLNKEVDAVAVFSTNEFPMFNKKLGIELQPMYLADYGFDVAGLTLAANNKFLADNPNTAKRFLAAVNEGFKYTIDNPEEAAAIAKKLFPDTVDEELTVMQIQRTGELAVLEGKPFGWVSEENITHTSSVLFESGLIKKQLPATDYFTNEYSPQP
ncbi:ABC transporter substrate-binding protein [Paenibacillus sp. 2TAB19]|uniref:ABC transporter substrate-binding protein n=1 Tax=Paenibacillus sp. 2TAB19 TaxID=3233003 RepID=UPI003F9D7670